MSIIEADAETTSAFDQAVADTQRYIDSPRFEGITRLYTARQVVEQRGTIPVDYTVAREASRPSTARLRNCSPRRRASPPSGPTPRSGRDHEADRHRGHLPRRLGDLGQGSVTEDPGPDLASYPLSQVPDEAAGLVRAPCSPPTVTSSSCGCR